MQFEGAICYKDNINREAVPLSTTWDPLLVDLTVRELTDHTNNASGVTPTGHSPLTGPTTSIIYEYARLVPIRDELAYQPHRHI